jgi:hypothetical protein
MISALTQGDEDLGNFCSECGESAITKCPGCSTPIRAQWPVPDRPGFITTRLPKVCHNCSAQYPWTNRAIESARDLVAEIAELNDNEKKILTQSLDDLIKDSPQTELAAIRFKKIITKAGKETAGAFKTILIDIASEAAKKAIWPSQ